MPTPDALDAAAGRLDLEADRLRRALDDVVRHTGANVWVGPAADTFTIELDGHRRSLGAAADSLHTTARSLRRQAAAMRDEAAAAARAGTGTSRGPDTWR